MKYALSLFTLLIPSWPMVAKTCINEAFSLKKGETLKENITAFRGNIAILGNLDDSIFQIGGRLYINGEITQEVITIGTTVELGDQAIIRKDLFVFGGSLQKNAACQVLGETFQVKKRDDLRQIAQTIMPFLPANSGATFFNIFMIPMWFIIAMIMLLILGTRINYAEELLLQSPLKIGIIGLVGAMVFLFLFIVFFIACFFIIGIPFLGALFLLYFVMLFWGHTIIFYTIGHQFCHISKIRQAGAVMYIFFGVVFYALFKFIPHVGSVILVIMNFYVLGIAIGFLGRKKFFADRSPHSPKL